MELLLAIATTLVKFSLAIIIMCIIIIANEYRDWSLNYNYSYQSLSTFQIFEQIDS